MSQLASGHNVEVLEGEELARQMRDWRGYKKGLVRLTPGPWVMPKGFLKFADKFYEFKFRPNDVLIMTYPKCGTTWTQEIVWTMRNNPDLTSPDAALPILVKSPFLE
ncbi:Sulfotransferase 1C4 [Chionoecetes opilio]|uniref:Sulfotransferase 1C4 n=1 Tax=Chionoecetes opilio TaxID=41210 RepID=A0A8J4YHE4_CHIOP|nr:Sulfotransferase 1C4 [Chionoecetes opilio]